MRYLATNAGTAHVVIKNSPCPIVRRNVDNWKGQRSLKPNAVLEGYKDCIKCGTFHHARAEVRDASKRAEDQRLNEQEVKRFNAKREGTAKPRRTRHRESPVSKLRKEARNAAAREPVADERTMAKAKEHRAIAEEHGWTVTVTENERRGLTVTATKGDETCVLAYRENGVLWNDEIRFKVPGRSVPMHNSGTWRRQVSLPEGQRPISARPKRFGRKRTSVAIEQDESANGEPTGDEINGEVIPLNVSSLPFLKDADDLEIIDAIKGQVLYWRNNMMAKVVSARVPSKPRLIRFGTTGRAQRRFVSFPEAEMSKDGEIYGPERSVAIDDMLRIRP